MIIETNTTTASCVEPMIHIGHCPTQSGNKNFSDFNWFQNIPELTSPSIKQKLKGTETYMGIHSWVL